MQARTRAGEEHDVVRVALALQEDARELVVVAGEIYSLRRKPADM